MKKLTRTIGLLLVLMAAFSTNTQSGEKYLNMDAPPKLTITCCPESCSTAIVDEETTSPLLMLIQF
ncbi:hypothetical protein [Flavihumibacter petaseus]|uniref:hypothetical protein n=1 Tax=Flavihumibacter petaseus TaxID=549295 RepID=UPI00061D3650|nr:hypothetical protein [Flavihumibacter petaseus]